MINAVQDAAHPAPDMKSADILNRFPDTRPADGGADLPHAYFVEEARLRPRAGRVHHLADPHRTKPEEFQSSACFDAWARDEDTV